MKKIFVNFDDEFYLTQYSFNDIELKEAFMEDDFEIKFGYTRVKEEEGKLVLYNSTILKTKYYYDEELEVSRQEIILQIDEYKQKLRETDYVVAKIAEAQALGKEVSHLINKYSETLAMREIYREKINELEESLVI